MASVAVYGQVGGFKGAAEAVKPLTDALGTALNAKSNAMAEIPVGGEVLPVQAAALQQDAEKLKEYIGNQPLFWSSESDPEYQKMVQDREVAIAQFKQSTPVVTEQQKAYAKDAEKEAVWEGKKLSTYSGADTLSGLYNYDTSVLGEEAKTNPLGAALNYTGQHLKSFGKLPPRPENGTLQTAVKISDESPTLKNLLDQKLIKSGYNERSIGDMNSYQKLATLNDDELRKVWETEVLNNQKFQSAVLYDQRVGKEYNEQRDEDLFEQWKDLIKRTDSKEITYKEGEGDGGGTLRSLTYETSQTPKVEGNNIVLNPSVILGDYSVMGQNVVGLKKENGKEYALVSFRDPKTKEVTIQTVLDKNIVNGYKHKVEKDKRNVKALNEYESKEAETIDAKQEIGFIKDEIKLSVSKEKDSSLFSGENAADHFVTNMKKAGYVFSDELEGEIKALDADELIQEDIARGIYEKLFSDPTNAMRVKDKNEREGSIKPKQTATENKSFTIDPATGNVIFNN